MRPALLTAALLIFLQGWGNFVFPVAFIQRKELQPMSVALFYFVGEYGVRWNMLFAASAIYALPPVVAVIVAGRGLVAGLTAGALRG
jgi:ABC-type glycerol-3-phosphate transport system permease component